MNIQNAKTRPRVNATAYHRKANVGRYRPLVDFIIILLCDHRGLVDTDTRATCLAPVSTREFADSDYLYSNKTASQYFKPVSYD